MNGTSKSLLFVLCAGFLFVTCVSCGMSAKKTDEIRWENRARDFSSGKEKPVEPQGVKTAFEKQSEKALDDEVLTLKEALGLALTRSESLKIQSEEIRKQIASQRKVIASILPKIRGHYSYTEDEREIAFGGETFQPKSREEYWVTVDQPVINAEFFPARKAVKQAKKIEELRLRDQREKLLFNVASQFYRVLQIEADIRALEKSLKSAKEFVNISKSRYRAGAASRDEVLGAKSRLNDVRARLIQSREKRNEIRSGLAELIEIDDLPERLKEGYETVRSETDISELVERALEKREDMKMAEREILRNKSLLRRKQSRYLPTVDLRYTDWTSMVGGFNEINEWTVSVDAQWTVFDGGAREAEIAGAYSGFRQSKLRKKQLEDKIKREVREKVHAYRSLEKSLKFFSAKSDSAGETAQIVKNRYKAGEATNLDVLRAEETAENARRDYERTKLAGRLAFLRIRLASGAFEESEILQRIFK